MMNFSAACEACTLQLSLIERYASASMRANACRARSATALASVSEAFSDSGRSSRIPSLAGIFAEEMIHVVENLHVIAEKADRLQNQRPVRPPRQSSSSVSSTDGPIHGPPLAPWLWKANHHCGISGTRAATSSAVCRASSA